MSEAREQRALAHGKKSGSSKELLVVAVLGIVFVLMVLFVIFAT